MLHGAWAGWAGAVARSLGGAHAAPRVRARAALLADCSTGEVLYAQDPHAAVAPASITKLMTLRLALRALRAGDLAWEEEVTVSERAAAHHPDFRGASCMDLRAGDRVAVGDLLKGVAVPSACDAAMALAERLSGSAAAFVEQMNAEARRLGMRHTRFVDPHGLSAANRTTAGDLLLLARRYVQEEPEALARLHSLPCFVFGGRVLRATNLLLGRYPGVDGLKTGFLDEAGYHQITTAVRDGRRLIGIVLGTASKRARRDESAALLDLGFRRLAT
ncbi:D-alanyl-D-alanine carboxypeptidase [Symbiobacterium terraclitae]|uniref:D-alanyl-D-alanine carboxypeptidase n=1 Tax=Symbiobacterium terraclitae TaxID=557451 RepID=A0ABS4JWX3_9FIRM|nr:D-alanyl-D-alanine carboxypeptidase family protein [Symbiobacterium terraclitae]MBP2020033.1 D-alanyl-D-alanine carboxypeptidase [Symbiobacterium terraclitae]